MTPFQMDQETLRDGRWKAIDNIIAAHQGGRLSREAAIKEIKHIQDVTGTWPVDAVSEDAIRRIAQGNTDGLVRHHPNERQWSAEDLLQNPPKDYDDYCKRSAASDGTILVTTEEHNDLHKNGVQPRTRPLDPNRPENVFPPGGVSQDVRKTIEGPYVKKAFPDLCS